jgi:hypothetical protein
MSRDKHDYIEIGKFIIGFYFLILFVGISFYLLCGCSSINRKLGLDDDNIIEESAEAVLKKHTGLDLDFTPNSKEE